MLKKSAETPKQIPLSKTPYGETWVFCPHAAINILKKSAETPYQRPQANKPYGTKEDYEVFKFSAWDPVRLGNRTYRTWGSEAVFPLKLTLMVLFLL